MYKTPYLKKLLDPQWQKKRLLILKRDNFSCRYCGDETKTLHVHHTYYITGNDPWEYPDESLITLCCDCHDNETVLSKEIPQLLYRFFMKAGFLPIHMESFLFIDADIDFSSELQPEELLSAFSRVFSDKNLQDYVINDYISDRLLKQASNDDDLPF